MTVDTEEIKPWDSVRKTLRTAPHQTRPPDVQSYSGGMNCAALLEALKDQRLTRTDLAILGALIRIDGRAPPTRKEVAVEAKCAASSVPRSARKLEELGYVERIVDSRDHGGRAKPTGYRLKADTYQDRHVPGSVHSQIDTLDIAFWAGQKPQDEPARIHADTSKSPPMIYNSTPQEIYPETVQGVFDVVDAREPAWKLAKHIIEIVDSPYLDLNASAKLPRTSARIRAWIDAGADLEADIIPTIKDACRRMNGHGETIHNWSYFDNPIRKAAAARKAAETPMQPISAEEARYEPSTNNSGYASGRGRKRSAATDILMRDILEGQSRNVG